MSGDTAMPLVSVIMPAFNAATTIKAAIDSAFDDGTVPVEVLVADDGSDDETPQAVADLGDDRIRVLSTGGRKLGANAGRNVAIDAAQGEWVAFLDPDDTWIPGRLATLLDAAEKTGAEWIADDILIVYQDARGRETRRSTVLTERGFSLDVFREITLRDLVEYDLGVLQPMIKRDLLENPRIRFPRPATSDFNFLFWSLEASRRAGVVNQAMYRYNKVEGVETMSHASPSFWLDSVESTAQLLADSQDLDGRVTTALERRLLNSTRKYHYLKMRGVLRDGHVLQALAQGVRHPSTLWMAAGSFGRSFASRTKRRAKTER